MIKTMDSYCTSFYCVILIGLCSLSIDTQAEVHKWVDEKGRVHYGDKPPENQQSSEKLKIDNALPHQRTNNYRGDSVSTSFSTSHSSPSPSFSKSVVLKIRNLFEQNKFNQIISILDNQQAKAKSNVSFERQLFTAYSAFDFNDQNYESKFKLWINDNPDSFHAHLARAKFYYALGWKSRGGKFRSQTKQSQFNRMNSYFDKAKSDTAKAISLNQRSIVPYCLLIGIAQAHGDSAKAKLTLMQAIKIDPASYIVREHYMNTLLPRWGGSIAKMQTFAENSMQYYPMNPKLKLLQGFNSMDSGDIESRRGNYGLASQLYEQAAKFGENYGVLFKQGKNEYRQKHYAKALKYFDQSIRLQPEYGDYYYWRSKARSQLNQNSQALADLKKAELFNPNDDKIRRNTKRLLTKLAIPGITPMSGSKASRELAKVEQALSREPNNSALYYERATVLLSQHKNDDALRDLEKAIKLNRHVFEYYRLIDMVLFKRNEFDRILNYWQQYIAIFPKDGRGFLERSGTYYHMQRIELAMADAKTAMDLGNVKAKKIYVKLEALNRR